MNAGQALQQGRERLLAAGIGGAAREAASLLASIVGWTPHRVYVYPGHPLTARQLEGLEALLARRAQGEPLQYLLGHQEFMSLQFSVGPGVLIPRPETELLVELAVACRPRTVVDVGTGSGAIAVSVAALCPEAVVYATDISPDALAYARVNAAFHAVEARVRFFPGDLLAPLAGQGLEGDVDVVVSNPPYIARSQWDSLPREVREYEPRVSLDGGEDGLDVYRRLAIPAHPYLSPGGRLLLECGEGQAEGVRGILEQAGWQVEGIHRDLAGIQRAIQARRR